MYWKVKDKLLSTRGLGSVAAQRTFFVCREKNSQLQPIVVPWLEAQAPQVRDNNSKGNWTLHKFSQQISPEPFSPGICDCDAEKIYTVQGFSNDAFIWAK